MTSVENPQQQKTPSWGSHRFSKEEGQRSADHLFSSLFSVVAVDELLLYQFPCSHRNFGCKPSPCTPWNLRRGGAPTHWMLYGIMNATIRANFEPPTSQNFAVLNFVAVSESRILAILSSGVNARSIFFGDASCGIRGRV